MGVNPKDKSGAEAPRQFDCASMIVLSAILRKHWLETLTVFLFLWIALVMWSVNDMLHMQQFVLHTNSVQVRDQSSKMERKLHIRL